VSVKARVVSRDERDEGIRASLNLGHTVGHALEAASGYTKYTHGEAVALGLCAALGIGQRLGVTSAALGARVVRVLAKLGLPTDLGAAPLSEAVDFLARDKKRRGTYIHFVLVSEPGRVEIQSLPLEQLRRLTLST
jgi:3-dehydroquinate synthetase